MRVYLPVTKNELIKLSSGERLADLSGYSVTPEWAAAQEDQDPEFLEEVLLYMAAGTALPRIVLVAEVPAEVIAPVDGQIKVSGEFGQKQLQAMFADDPETTSKIKAGADPNDLDMTWFGPTETLNLLEFLSS